LTTFGRAEKNFEIENSLKFEVTLRIHGDQLGHVASFNAVKLSNGQGLSDKVDLKFLETDDAEFLNEPENDNGESLREDSDEEIEIDSDSQEHESDDEFLNDLDNDNEIDSFSYRKGFVKVDENEILLQCGDKVFPVHESALTDNSSIFAAMLSPGSAGIKQPVLTISDWDPSIAGIIVHYLYLKTLPKDLKVEDAAKILSANKIYDIKGLRNATLSTLCKNLSECSFAGTFTLCDEYGVTSKINKLMERYLIRNGIEVPKESRSRSRGPSRKRARK